MAGKKNETPEGVQVEQAQQQVQQPPEQPDNSVVCVRSVSGRMVDMVKNRVIDQEPVEIAGEIKEGSWLDCQIKAGKIERV